MRTFQFCESKVDAVMRKTTFWAKWIVSLENMAGSLCVDPAIL
jgi:hypothetical protein